MQPSVRMVSSSVNSVFVTVFSSDTGVRHDHLGWATRGLAWNGTCLVDTTGPRVQEDFTLLYCVDLYAVCVVWYLATTSVLVGGNVVMVELPVSRDAMLHFVVCSLGTTCRGLTTALCPCLKSKLKDSGRIRDALPSLKGYVLIICTLRLL